MKHLTPPALRHLEAKLLELERTGLLRVRPEPSANVGRSFCSNDYLGLAEAGPIRTGAGASRLIVGECAEHRALEGHLARWLGAHDALLFSSGYAANLGVITALADAEDLVVSDALNHASIIDGCRLARARTVVVPHLDLDAVERALAQPRIGRAWVIFESYFSMDADGPDLPRLRALCDRAGAALILDEAHALGVFGPQGRGLAAAAGVEPDVRVGALGKAFGASGAFVAGSRPLVDWLWNRARSFVFSTGMSPMVATSAQSALLRIASSDDLRGRLGANVSRLRAGFRALGLDPLGHGPIIPLVIGDSHRALRAAAELRRAGIYVQAVRPPTVQEGMARLRITATAAQSAGDIDQALEAFTETLPWLTRSS